MGKVPHITGFWEEGKSAGKPDSEPILMDIDILEHHLVDQKWWLPLLQDGQEQRWRRWLEKDKKERLIFIIESQFFLIYCSLLVWLSIFFPIEKSPLIQRTFRLEIVFPSQSEGIGISTEIPTSLIRTIDMVRKCTAKFLVNLIAFKDSTKNFSIFDLKMIDRHSTLKDIIQEFSKLLFYIAYNTALSIGCVFCPKDFILWITNRVYKLTKAMCLFLNCSYPFHRQ